MISKTLKATSLNLPIIGIGTYQLRGALCYQTLNFALSLGYKHIDCSPSYQNEHMVSISLTRLSRSSLFLTSKLSYGYYTASNAKYSLSKTLSHLKTDYLDLFLLEWPSCRITGRNSEFNTFREGRAAAWKSLIEFKKSGLVKHIGVCNFTQEHIESLLVDTKVLPEVLQVEIHPLNWNKKLLEYCEKNEIQVIAHTPLGRGSRELMDNLDVITLARKYRVSCAQVVLRWNVGKGNAVIPRSSNFEHLRNNVELNFEMEKEDLELLDGLNRGLYISTDPTKIN